LSNASYDVWGNVTSRNYNGQTATLSYDVLDDLVQWNAGSSSQEWYAYDFGGRRVLKRSTTSSGTSLTVYAFGLEEHVYDASGNNTGNTYYYTLGGRLVGKSDGSHTQYYLTDALGSVLSTFSNTAGTATLLGNQAYGPYGNQRYKSGTLGTDKGFTGQYGDATGLDYYNARYYDPVVGRFLSADDVQGNFQGMDPYDYVGGNPETFADPTGYASDGNTPPWASTGNTSTPSFSISFGGLFSLQFPIFGSSSPYTAIQDADRGIACLSCKQDLGPNIFIFIPMPLFNIIITFPPPKEPNTQITVPTDPPAQEVGPQKQAPSGILANDSNKGGDNEPTPAKAAVENHEAAKQATEKSEPTQPKPTQQAAKPSEDGKFAQIVQQLSIDLTVTVIGESMNRVRNVADQLGEAGFDVKIYEPKNWRGGIDLDMEANRSWIRYWAKEKGSQIVDIGKDPNRPEGRRSPYYAMESRSVMRWGIIPFSYNP